MKNRSQGTISGGGLFVGMLAISALFHVAVILFGRIQNDPAAVHLDVVPIHLAINAMDPAGGAESGTHELPPEEPENSEEIVEPVPLPPEPEILTTEEPMPEAVIVPQSVPEPTPQATPVPASTPQPTRSKVTPRTKTRSQAAGNLAPGVPGGSSRSGVVEAKPDYARNPPPPYPETARRNGWQGRVLVHATVRANGTVETVQLHQGSGHAMLDQAALEAVRRWRFRPRTVGGVAQQATVEVPVTFSLNKR